MSSLNYQQNVNVLLKDKNIFNKLRKIPQIIFKYIYIKKKKKTTTTTLINQFIGLRLFFKKLLLLFKFLSFFIKNKIKKLKSNL
jgi:hypothetical protein